MSEEELLEELNYTADDDYIEVRSSKLIKEIVKENQQLKEKIKQYEDPEDLTLMFMYCDEKAKDKIKELQKQITKAIGIAEQYGQIDGEHHKMWVIDQMLREFLSNEYDKWLKKYNTYSRENDYEEWDYGIAP